MKGALMSNKLYVGNLTEDTTEEDLLFNFNSLGTCISARIIKDRKTGRSKGFAFVEMATEAEAQEVIRRCKGVELDGNRLIVSEAHAERQKRQRRSGMHR